MLGHWRFAGRLLVFSALAAAQSYTPPAGIRPPRVGTAVSILPGGRVVAPFGEQHMTGAEPMALAVSASGKTVVTTNRGPSRPSLTVMERENNWQIRHLPPLFAGREGRDGASANDLWHSVWGGLAFSGEHAVFVSEGNTGRVSLIDLETGDERRSFDVDPTGATGGLVFDPLRNILYVADLVHPKITALDTRSRQALATLQLDGIPTALALDGARHKLYVATAANLLDEQGRGGAQVWSIDASQPHLLRKEAVIRASDWGASGLDGVLVAADHVFVSDVNHGSITVIDPRTGHIEARIIIRIPGFEDFGSTLPIGMAFDEHSGSLLVAEAGINAVGIIDAQSRQVLGHVPVGWFPTQVLVSRGMVYAANARGPGNGPNLRFGPGPRGSVSIFPMPDPKTLAAHSRFVLEAAGLVARPVIPPALPKAIRYVVLIIKDGRSFDEVFGDLSSAANGAVMGAPQLARFGHDGYVSGHKQRLSLHHLNVTPNHHAIAAQWTVSDNFYADADTAEDGVHWLSVHSHLLRHAVPFYDFGAAFDPNVRDTDRVRQVIEKIESKLEKTNSRALLTIRLPNDRMAPPNPQSGFPYEESYLADNDLALGRLLEYLSGTPWWGQMAVFVTEASAGDGRDHIDSHRTLLLCAGPWARRNSVLHTNANFPGLLKTIFRLLDVPPMDLFDASAGDLSGCFTDKPELARYQALPVDPRLYRP